MSTFRLRSRDAALSTLVQEYLGEKYTRGSRHARSGAVITFDGDEMIALGGEIVDALRAAR